MADIYTRMAAVADRLLSPAVGPGTFGQGEIVLVRYTAVAPVNEWDAPTAPTESRTTLKGAARGVSVELVGNDLAPGVQIEASDLVVIVAPWGGAYAAGDVMEIDGALHTIMRVDRIPAAGTVSAFRFYVRGMAGSPSAGLAWDDLRTWDDNDVWAE